MRREHLSLNDESCQASENGTHYVLQTSFIGCQTRMRQHSSNEIVYENAVSTRTCSASECVLNAVQ